MLILPITRKSYTTEVRMAIDKVRTYPQVTTLAITCDKDSEKYNDYYILSPDTAEDSVIMTRSFTSMLYMAVIIHIHTYPCLLYTSPSPRDRTRSRMPSSA